MPCRDIGRPQPDVQHIAPLRVVSPRTAATRPARRGSPRRCSPADPAGRSPGRHARTADPPRHRHDGPLGPRCRRRGASDTLLPVPYTRHPRRPGRPRCRARRRGWRRSPQPPAPCQSSGHPRGSSFSVEPHSTRRCHGHPDHRPTASCHPVDDRQHRPTVAARHHRPRRHGAGRRVRPRRRQGRESTPPSSPGGRNRPG